MVGIFMLAHIGVACERNDFNTSRVTISTSFGNRKSEAEASASVMINFKVFIVELIRAGHRAHDLPLHEASRSRLPHFPSCRLASYTRCSTFSYLK